MSAEARIVKLLLVGRKYKFFGNGRRQMMDPHLSMKSSSQGKRMWEIKMAVMMTLLNPPSHLK